MIKQILQMGAVLTIVAFLMAGCAVSGVNSVSKFDFSTMRTYEEQTASVGQMARWLPNFLQSSERDKVDWAFSYYYGGQVALAEGDHQKAEAYFKRADILIEEALEGMRDTLMEQETGKLKKDKEGLTL